MKTIAILAIIVVVIALIVKFGFKKSIKFTLLTGFGLVVVACLAVAGLNMFRNSSGVFRARHPHAVKMDIERQFILDIEESGNELALTFASASTWQRGYVNISRGLRDREAGASKISIMILKDYTAEEHQQFIAELNDIERQEDLKILDRLAEIQEQRDREVAAIRARGLLDSEEAVYINQVIEQTRQQIIELQRYAGSEEFKARKEQLIANRINAVTHAAPMKVSPQSRPLEHGAELSFNPAFAIKSRINPTMVPVRVWLTDENGLIYSADIGWAYLDHITRDNPLTIEDESIDADEYRPSTTPVVIVATAETETQPRIRRVLQDVVTATTSDWTSSEVSVQKNEIFEFGPVNTKEDILRLRVRSGGADFQPPQPVELYDGRYVCRIRFTSPSGGAPLRVKLTQGEDLPIEINRYPY